MSNITTATFAEGCRSTIASPALTQWSYGQVLEFSGIDLPDNYTVYFALSRTSGDAQAMIGDANGVQVPNNLLCVGHSITAWVFLTDGTSGQREYTVLIPVDPAAAPATEEPTPEQESVINQTIAALNAGVTRAETAADAAEGSAQAAAGSATFAAEDAAAAAGSASDAAASATAAAGSATAAEAAADAAAASEQAASASEQAAAASATAAEGSAAVADARADAAALSATEAAASATAAAQSAGAAAQSATAAAGSATAADGSASDAAGSASAAAASATAASGSAATAESKAGEAAASAADAATAETGAQAAQTAAEAAQAAAETAQGEAEDAAQSVSESAAQIATNIADIADLKSAIGELAITKVTSKRINPQNGNIESNSNNVGYFEADISAFGGFVSGYTRQNPNFGGYAFYDANDIYIPGSGGTNPSTSSYDFNYSLAIPTGACFFRMSCSNSYLNSATLFASDMLKVVGESAKNLRKNDLNQIKANLLGDTEYFTTEGYVTHQYAFEEGRFYKFTLISNLSSTVNVNADIKDSNNNTIKTIYLRSIGDQNIWSCNSNDAVAIRWGSASASVVSVNDMSGIEENGRVFWCGPTRELSTLKAGIEEATKYMNATLYVDPGTYDLVDEFGTDFFDNLDAGTGVHAGLKLKNGIHIIFSPNSKVISHYTGSNQYAQSYYSPFNTEQYGFTIENLTIEASRCRYVFHDERDGATELCRSIYKNCSMLIDNSENDYWENVSPIGGGLGSNHEVLVENCIINGIGVTTPRSAISYHCSNDTSNPDYKARITIKDCYMIKGTVVLDMYRQDGAKKTPVIVTNCSMPTVAGAESNGLVYGPNFNQNVVEIYAWNNQIRSN